MMKKLKKRNGFTLIEIIVVIVILAVLMAVAVPSVMNYINEGTNAKYEAVARSAMINTQSQLAKAYAKVNDSSKTTETGGGEQNPSGTMENHSNTGPIAEAIKMTNDDSKSVQVKTIEVYDKSNSNAAVTDEKINQGYDPSGISKYVVTFESGKVATVTPNKPVTIS